MPSLKTRQPDLNDPQIQYHALIREFGSLDRWGFPTPVPKEARVAMGKAILAVACADGKVSERERTFLLGRAKTVGGTEEDLRELAAFDPKSASIDDLVADIPPAARRLVLYDAVMVARSDGFGEKERIAAVKVANQLGLSPEFIDALEAQFLVEDGVTEARIRLMTDPSA